MKGLRLFAAALALCFVTAAPGWAAPPAQGGVEGSVMMGGWFLSDDVDDMVGLSAQLGIQYTREIAFGLRVETGFGGDKLYDVAAEGRYYFLHSEVAVPYVGAMVGPAWIRVDGDSDPAMKTAAFGGFKYYVDPRISIFVEAQMGLILGGPDASFGAMALGVSAKL